MHIDWSTLLLQLLNFAILVWLLQRFLYRPVLRMIDARRAAVARQYTEAHQAEQQAKQQLSALEAQRAAIATARAAVLKATVADAEQQAALRRAQAEREARALVEDGRKALAQQREQLLEEARASSFELAAQLVRRLLAELPERLRSEAWLERIERHLQGLPQSVRSELIAQLKGNAALTVATAVALEDGLDEAWRNRLQRALQSTLTIAYTVDPELLAGAELRFPHATLGFSVSSALAALRSEGQPDAGTH